VTQTAYNADNQLATWGTANLFYDANGNMTSDGTHSYTWDARNRLSQIDLGNTASFMYDPFGRRVSKTIVGTQTGFLFDGPDPVQELSGTTPTANLLTGGLDEYFTRTDSSGTRDFITDPLGSTVALVDSTGALQTQYTYEPFGNTTLSGGGTTNSFTYTSRELDATGIYYYRARYYNPQFARFISEDPIEFSAGDTNLYAYVRNDPISLTDPLGLSATWWGSFRDDDVPPSEKECYNQCTQGQDFLPYAAGVWGGAVAGMASGIVLGSPALGVGAIPGAFIGVVAGAVAAGWGTYQAANTIDKDCKAKCHKKSCKQ